jgi:hypothetical protein
LVVRFFTCVCLLCRDNANRVRLTFGKSDYHEPPANESEADFPGLVVVFRLSGPTNIRPPNISGIFRKSMPCLAMFDFRFIPFKPHSGSVHTDCRYVKAGKFWLKR